MVWPEDGHSGCVYNSSFPSLNDSCVEHITTHRLSNLTNVCWFRCEIHSVQCRGRINVDSVCVRSWANLWAEKDTNHLKVKWNVYTTRNDWISRRQTCRTNKRKKRKRNTQLKHWPIYIHKYIYLAREFIDQTIFPVFSNYSVEESEKPNKKWTKIEFMPLFERIDCKWSPYVLAFAVCINISLFPFAVVVRRS